MKRTLLAISAIGGLLFGCSDRPAAPELADFDLAAQFEGVRGEKVSAIAGHCTLEPLPHVTYTIGNVRASRGGEIRVPVYVDTEGLDLWGGLLFVDFEASRLDGVRVEAGELWDGAGFTHAVDNVLVDGVFGFLILGWAPDAGPIAAERTRLPFAYMIYRAERPGRAALGWSPVPEGVLFHRRGEALVETDACGPWNLIDFYKSRPNETGLLDVVGGSIVATAVPTLD